MKQRIEDKNKSGIYCIYNKVNGKKYVGKSNNIYRRIWEHVNYLDRSDKNENRYLINAWHKYGKENFDYKVLEYLDCDNELLAEKELYYMIQEKSTDRTYGYNLRMDSSTGCITHEETRKLKSELNKGENNPNYGNSWSDDKKQRMSELKKQQYANGEVAYDKTACYKGIESRNKRWEENPELKETMKKKVKERVTRYKIQKWSKDGTTLLKTYDYVADIIEENPEYKRHNIYSACSGAKPSIYGFKWKKVLIDDIVQMQLKDCE
jgi:group I intron endonuclease